VTVCNDAATRFVVMAGLDPAIHVFDAKKKVVDGGHKRGHDEEFVSRGK
jgi:hypothetical protein